jgi:hypothetical protein
MWGAAPSQQIVIIFCRFNGLADIINYVKFQNDRSKGFRSAGASKWNAPIGKRSRL